MKALFFDAGPVITLVMARLSWMLPALKEKFDGEFYITPAVKHELVDRPLQTKRFQFEALQVMKLINDGVFTVYQEVPEKQVKQLLTLANKSFKVKGKTMDIIQQGEMEAIATAHGLPDAAVVMDERTLRLFVEKPQCLEELLEHRFKRDIVANPEKMQQFQSVVSGVTIIRSIELIALAYKFGMLQGYLPKQPRAKEMLLNAVFWAAKTNGCAVTAHEIEELKHLLLK